MKVKRFDAVELKGEIVRTPEGYLKGDAIVTRIGIFQYQQWDGSIRNELRHPNDVFKAASLKSLQMRPITLLHPDELIVTAETAKSLSRGFTGEVIEIDSPYIITSLIITDKEAVDAVENGLRELSMGYFVTLLPEKGVFDGIEYEFRQTEIDYNHLAIVERARAGPNARLNLVDHLGKQDAILVDFKPLIKNDSNIKVDEGNSMDPKLIKLMLDNGIPYDAAPEIKVAFDAMQAQVKTLQATIDALKDVTINEKVVGKADVTALAAIDRLTGEFDGLKKDNEKLKEDASSEKFREKVKIRTALEKVATATLDSETIKKMADMDDSEIKKAVILSHEDESDRDAVAKQLEGKSDDYLNGLFHSIARKTPVGDGDSSIARQRAATSDASALHSPREPECDSDKARQEHIDKTKALSRGEEDPTKKK